MTAVAAPAAPSPAPAEDRLGPAWWAALAVLGVVLSGWVWLGTATPLSVVLSGSMEPTVSRHDVVLLSRVGEGGPRVGDVVLVSVRAADQRRHRYPERVLHRVTAVADGRVTTRGDALDDVDPFTTPVGAVRSRYVGTLPLGSVVVRAVGGHPGLALAGIAGVLLLGVLGRERLSPEAVRRAVVGTGPVPVAARATAVEEQLARLVEVTARQADSIATLTDAVTRLVASQLPPSSPDRVIDLTLVPADAVEVSPGGDGELGPVRRRTGPSPTDVRLRGHRSVVLARASRPRAALSPSDVRLSLGRPVLLRRPPATASSA